LTRADAITFAGGTNILELQAGSTITGNVVAFSSADTLRLGGSASASFDVSQIGAAAQYRNFGVFEKTGASTWTLTGSTTAVTPWTINQGMLVVSADSNLGAASGGLTFNGGTLQFGTSFNLANTRTITLAAGGGTIDTGGFNTTIAQGIGGVGGLTKAGAGDLTLSGPGMRTDQHQCGDAEGGSGECLRDGEQLHGRVGRDPRPQQPQPDDWVARWRRSCSARLGNADFRRR